jgi:hypothetical protein
MLCILQCNPPERAAKQEKERTPMELFIRHLIYDVLTKKTIDKVLKFIRKLDWNDDAVRRTLYKVFTKPWKVKYGNIALLAMLTYDLQRYYPAFAISVVDQVLEDIRRGLEQNVYSINQRRLATIKYLGELYIYRLFSSALIFDTFWTLVTFGHRKYGAERAVVHWLTRPQPRVDPSQANRVPSICLTTISVFVWFACCWTHAACVSIGAHSRRSSTTF